MRLIDAEALEARMYHDAFETDTDMQRWDSGCWIRYKMFEKAIAEAPTIEPERKTGKWVPFEYGDDTWHKCTACGVADNYIDIVHRPNNSIGRLVHVRNFCPNCGADMRGEEDG